MVEQPIRVVLVDHDEELRDLLSLLVELDHRFALAAAVGTASAASELVRSLVPDVVMIDLDLPDVAGLALLDELGALGLGVRLVVFSSFPDPLTLVEVLRRGAHAYLDRATAWAELLPAVAALLRGAEATVSA